MPRDSMTLPRGRSMVQICVPGVARHEAINRTSVRDPLGPQAANFDHESHVSHTHDRQNGELVEATK